MKKTIVLIRHAKAEWMSPMGNDFARNLNDRGNHDAPLMGRRLKELKLIPDLIVSSNAARTLQTAEKIADAVGYPQERIKLEPMLYHCMPSTFTEVIQNLDNETSTAFLIAHNPGISEFANELAEKFRIDDMPTCGIVAVEAECNDWAGFETAKKEVTLFESPKKLYDSK